MTAFSNNIVLLSLENQIRQGDDNSGSGAQVALGEDPFFCVVWPNCDARSEGWGDTVGGNKAG